MKILIADDHWMVRESLKQVMNRLRERLELHEAETFDEACDVLRQHPDMDLMLADLVMPGFDEFAGLRRLRAQFPEVPVVVVSVLEDFDHLVRSVAQGVVGYIPKSASGPEIKLALERVLAGDVSFPRRILEQSSAGPVLPSSAAAAAAVGRNLDVLTKREREILGRLGEGCSVRRIAEELRLSDHTVRVHIGNLTRKLGLKGRAAVIHYAVSAANDGKARLVRAAKA